MDQMKLPLLSLYKYIFLSHQRQVKFYDHDMMQTNIDCNHRDIYDMIMDDAIDVIFMK